MFGVSRGICKTQAEKKTLTYDAKSKRDLTPVEWGERAATLAEQMFNESEKRTKISPEFDAPQFCRDWINVAPGEVRATVIMARGPKVDKHGAKVLRDGVPVMTWVEYGEQHAAGVVTA